MEKMKKKKTVNLDATFFPKRKRVLNKRALRVLDKKSPVSKKAKRQQPPVDPKTDDENALDSQSSITSIFWDSQGVGTTPPASPVSNHYHSTLPSHHHTTPPHYHLVTSPPPCHLTSTLRCLTLPPFVSGAWTTIGIVCHVTTTLPRYHRTTLPTFSSGAWVIIGIARHQHLATTPHHVATTPR